LIWRLAKIFITKSVDFLFFLNSTLQVICTVVFYFFLNIANILNQIIKSLFMCLSPKFDLESFRKKAVNKLTCNGKDLQIFNRALDFSYKHHNGQVRKSGDPYIIHPCAVVDILLFELELYDTDLLVGALLHDVVEDVKGVTINNIYENFGSNVAKIVDGCTKLERYRMSKKVLKDLTHKKILSKTSENIDIILIKFADRLHNLRTLSSLSRSKRQIIAKETVEVYVPVATKLNLYPFKEKLLDQALIYLFPRVSRKILNLIQKENNQREIKLIVNRLMDGFKKEDIKVKINVCPKGLGYFYDPVKKILSINYTENIIDFILILENESILDCYKVLGIVNSIFPPIPRKLRDFISNPKSYNYRSLHVRNNLYGKNYLMQIRTPEMDRVARKGIIADWKKRDNDEQVKEIKDHFRMIGEFNGSPESTKEIIQTAESKQLYLFTPAGESISLPAKSIVLDFAYKIHSEIGDNCIGGMVDRQHKDVDDELFDGQVVTIITHKTHPEWPIDLEKKCKTPKARSAVNRYRNQKLRNFAEKIGKEILLQTIHNKGLNPEILSSNELDYIFAILNVKNINDVYLRIGQDKLSPDAFLYYFKGYKNYYKTNEQNKFLAVITVDCPNCLFYKFSQCCNPFPGQDGIIGLLSERGISFHNIKCSELKRLKITSDKWLIINWKNGKWPVTNFNIELKEAKPFHVLKSLSSINGQFNIKTMNEVKRGNKINTSLCFEVNSLDQSKKIFYSLKNYRFQIVNYK